MPKRILKQVYRTISPLIPPLVDETLRMWRSLGYMPNIRSPRTFNEKIAHRKHFTRDHRFTNLADKLTVREFVKGQIGDEYLTHLYNHVTEVEELDWQTLPVTFVAKGRHDSGSVVIVDDKAREDRDLLWQRLRAMLQNVVNPTHYEYWYRDIPPGLLIEERLRDTRYFVPLDFKFFVFHGRVRFIQVFHDRMTRTTQRFYDTSWRPLSVRRPNAPLAPITERPKQLEHMIEVAETLGEEFDFVRVDLYAPNDERVVFGEMTFAPAAGRKPFVPQSFDRELGSYWHIGRVDSSGK